MKLRKTCTFPSLVSLAAITTTAIAAPGSLDTTFGSGGKVTANYGGSESAKAVATAPDGKIVVAGTTNVMGSEDMAVIRYNANGTLDTTFSGDGGVVTDLGVNSADTATCVAVQRDGKIVVGGYSNAQGGAGTSDFSVVRYNVDGSLDTFFGKNGKVFHNNSANEEGHAIRIQSDGKIVLVGATHIGASPDFAILRLNPDGSRDNTFNANGFRSYVLGVTDVDDVATCFVIQPDGKYLLGGYTEGPVSNRFALLRVHPDSFRDTSFNGNGEQSTAFGGDDRIAAITLQADGKIVAAGSWNEGACDMAVARYNTNGTLDTTFSGDGKTNIFFGGHASSSVEYATSVAVQPDGRIVVGGYTNAGNNNFGLARLNSNGSLDLSFDTDGMLTTSFSNLTSDRSFAGAVQADGRLVLAGFSGDDFSVARYHMISRVDARVGATNKTALGNNIFNTNAVGQTLDVAVKKSGGKKTSYVSIQNDGHSAESFTILASPSDKNFTVRYLIGSTDVTTKATGGYLTTGNLAPGASYILKVVVTAKAKTAKKKTNFTITGKSSSDSLNKDTVLIRAKTK